MKILALDTALGTTSLALSDGGQILATYHDDIPNNQASQLIPQIRGFLQDSGIDIQALDVIACTTGPGGFTSVRIGVAAARGLAFAANIPSHGVSLLEVMAFYCQQQVDTTFYCALPAGRKDMAVQKFNSGGTPASGRLLIAKQNLPTDVPLYSSAKHEACLYYDAHQNASHMCTMLYHSAPITFTPPTPIYARPPDAAIAKPLLRSSV